MPTLQGGLHSAAHNRYMCFPSIRSESTKEGTSKGRPQMIVACVLKSNVQSHIPVFLYCGHTLFIRSEWVRPSVWGEYCLELGTPEMEGAVFKAAPLSGYFCGLVRNASEKIYEAMKQLPTAFFRYNCQELKLGPSMKKTKALVVSS